MMEIRPAHIVILDISGYTRFIRKHRLALLHAEHIINDLLEHVIAATGFPLVVNKLQGDSVLMYALADETTHSAQGILEQVLRSFAAFRQRERELISECSLCSCSACATIDQLRLKAIIHHGPVVFKRVQKFDEIAGEDVIMAHRLLKNSISADEYILMSEAFDGLSGGRVAEHRREARQETCSGFGKVGVVAYYPLQADGLVPVKKSFAQRFMMALVLDKYILQRLLRRPARRFEHLDESQAPAPAEQVAPSCPTTPE